VFLAIYGVRPVSAIEGSYQQLLEVVRSRNIDLRELPTAQSRMSTAKALLRDCAAVLNRVPRDTPSVGITEDGPSDISGQRLELSRWRLAAIFTECSALTQKIIETQNVQQEICYWIELARLLDDNRMVQNLIVWAGISPRGHNQSAVISEVYGWRPAYDVMFGTMSKLLDKP
jgi:hypothetical protein